MAAHTSLLLVIALCAATAHSLQCYTCNSVFSNDNCLKATNCTKDETYCQTSVGSATVVALSGSLITKKCTQSCTPSNSSQTFISNYVTCCSTDLCNHSGGATIRSSGAAILLALGSVLIILKSSVL